MSKQLQDMFGKVAQQVASDPLVSNNYDMITERLLRFASKQGMTLEQCSSPLFMDRSIRTLKKQVRKIGDLTFSDYVPRKLKPKKSKKKRKSRARKA